MKTFTHQILLEFTDYIKLGLYYKAHEFLEDYWDKHSKEKENLYIKGLINAAVAMELIRKGRVPAGKKVIRNYYKYKIDSFYEINFKVENQYEKCINSRR